jgi:hypothetical protein
MFCSWWLGDYERPFHGDFAEDFTNRWGLSQVTSATIMNNTSSRSHAVFILKVREVEVAEVAVCFSESWGIAWIYRLWSVKHYGNILDDEILGDYTTEYEWGESEFSWESQPDPTSTMEWQRVFEDLHGGCKKWVDCHSIYLPKIDTSS